MGKTIRRRRTIVTLATAYEDQTPAAGEEFVIPEDLTALSDEELQQLHDTAVEHFDAAYGDGTGLTDSEMEALAALTEGIEALSTELQARVAAGEERDRAAAELAARVRPQAAEETPADEAEAEAPAEEAETEAEAEAEEPAESLAASGARRAIRVPMAAVRGRARPAAPAQEERREGAEPSIRDVLIASGDGLGVAVGQGVDFTEAAEMLDRRLGGYSPATYEAAHKSGRHIREQHSLLSIRRPIPEELMIRSNDPEHVRAVMDLAGDESRLPGGSLVASGTGWCAPSPTVFDFFPDQESRDGLLDIAEVGIVRGGLSFTPGPDFKDMFAEITGFSFTEEQDIAGEYAPNPTPGQPNVVGPKPCYHIECPPFEEHRLDVDGLCITAGILQSRGYPEMQARVIRGALTGHAHRMDGKMIAQMVAGSTAVSLAANQVGAAAPVLTAIELQVEHYRYTRRMARSTTLEAVFPFWVHGAIRSDLSRRLGVDLLSVTDAQIDAWFRERGVRPQFVYNWQALDTTAASAFTAWPTTVQFLLYAAGTWIRGGADVITLDTLYDSQLLGTNDFTALFTEEGWFVAKRGFDSRVVSVPIEAAGGTHMGVDIAHNGSLVPAA